MDKNDKQFVVQKIRSQYIEAETSELDELRELDKHVKRPANIFAYAFGSLAALIAGGGMSLIMTDIGNTLGIGDGMLPGVAIGLFGIIMAVINYPIYKSILENRKSKYAEQILKLCEKTINK